MVLISTALPPVADLTLRFFRETGLVGPGGPVQDHNVLFCTQAAAPPPPNPAPQPRPVDRARLRGASIGPGFAACRASRAGGRGFGAGPLLSRFGTGPLHGLETLRRRARLRDLSQGLPGPVPVRSACARACVRACVRARVRARVLARARARVCVCVCACVCGAP